MNAKEYRKLVGVSKTKYVLDWIDKGYLPNVKNPETGVIDIPSDMPRPYKSNGKTKKISKLIEEIIEAADLQQSLYPQMFGKIREDTYLRTIDSLIECQVISKQYSSTGALFYELGPNWKNYSSNEKNGILESVCKGIETCASIAQIVQVAMSVWPVLYQAAQMPVA